MEDLEAFLEVVFDSIVDEKHPGYYHQPIPNELDDEIGNLVRVFIEASAQGREAILSKSREANSFALIVFAERMAALAVRENSRRRLLEGLLALIIEGFKFDYRDNMTIWAPLYHSAAKIGVEPEGLFQEAASYARNTVSEWMLDFPKRSPEERGLRAFKFKETYAPDGFRYERVP